MECLTSVFTSHSNLTLMAPKNTTEMKYMLEYALNMDGPVAIRYPKENTMEMEKLSVATSKSEVGDPQGWQGCCHICCRIYD